MATPKRKHSIVLISWDDAEVSNSWEEIPTSDGEMDEGIVETIGFLVRETEKYYLIASTFDGTHTNARTKIPKGMVKSFKKLNV